MIQVEQLSRRYGEFTAVNKVSFSIEPGQIVGLLGHNGAGKTTIMKMLTGYLEPSGGRILINSLDITTSAAEIQQHLGYLPENLPVYPEMTVVDYLDYVATVRQLAPDQRDTAIREAIIATDLNAKALQPIAVLSRGYKQRVGVAQAILHKPKFLILDEPTNGLDPAQTQHMRELIQTLAKNSTVILSTHIMQEVNAICDRVLILNNGRLAIDEQLHTFRQSRGLYLATDADIAHVDAILQAEPMVESVQSQMAMTNTTANAYLLHLSESANLEQTAAAVAKRLLEGQCAIYALMPQQRDLETLFNEVSRNEEVAYAA